ICSGETLRRRNASTAAAVAHLHNEQASGETYADCHSLTEASPYSNAESTSGGRRREEEEEHSIANAAIDPKGLNEDDSDAAGKATFRRHWAARFLTIPGIVENRPS